MSLIPTDLQNVLPGLSLSEASNWAARLALINLVTTIESDRLKIQITPTRDGLHGGMGSATKTLIRFIHRVTAMGHQVIITADTLTIAPAVPPIPTLEELRSLNPSVPDDVLMGWRSLFIQDVDHVSVSIEGGEDRPARLLLKPLDEVGAAKLALAGEGIR